jgi:hypothetical protein
MVQPKITAAPGRSGKSTACEVAITEPPPSITNVMVAYAGLKASDESELRENSVPTNFI